MRVPKLLLSPLRIRIFCPKTTKFGPKLAFLVNLGQAMQAYSMPCCGSVGGCGARAVSRKTPIYFMIFRDETVLKTSWRIHHWPGIWDLYFAVCFVTGWSFATAIFYIFLTGTKKQQNHITQSFLSTSYIDILIFWGLTMVRWKKSCLSRLCQNSVMAPYCKG